MQAPHSHASKLHDAEVVLPVVPGVDAGDDEPGEIHGRHDGDAEQDEPTTGFRALVKDETTKVGVKREENATLATGALQDASVRAAWFVRVDPDHVVSRGPQPLDGSQRDIFVGEESHASLSRPGEGEDAFLLENFLRICQARPDVFRGHPRVAA